MKNINKYFMTSNFNLASFLIAKDYELINIERLANQKRANFVFVDKPEIDGLVHEFDFAPKNKEVVMVDARKLIHATKTLKEKLYQNSF